MPTKGITLKVAKKKAGTLSRARVRSVVAAIYGEHQPVSSKTSPVKVLVTPTDKKMPFSR